MPPSKSFLILTFLLITLSCCPDNCNDCDPSGSVCFACTHDFQLSVLGKCVPNTIVQRCTIYGPKNQCFVCEPSYQLHANKCTKQHTGCVNKNAMDHSCYECGFGKLLKDGICVGALNCLAPEEYCSQCPEGFEYGNGQCVDRTVGCAAVSKRGDGICETCKPEYKMVGYRCVKEGEMAPYCYVSYGEGKCDRCKNGYSLFRGYCLLPKQIQAVLNGETTMQTIVQRLLSQMKASNTYKTTIDPPHTTTPQPPTTTSQPPKPKQIINCINQVETTCLQCLTGYIPSRNLCLVSDPNCISYQFSTGSCTSCSYGYFLKDSRCVKVSQLCDGYDLMNGGCLGCKDKGRRVKDGKCVDGNCENSVEEKCVKCIEGFVVNGITGMCEYFDPNCDLPKENSCSQCKPSFYPNAKGLCWKLPTNCMYGNVIEQNSCIQCHEGYNLQPSGCQLIPEIRIQNCGKVQSGQCQFCNEGYYLTRSNKCAKRSGLCVDYLSGKCSKCVNGYGLVDGNCVDVNCQTIKEEKCIQCRKNYKVTAPLFLCEFNDPNCQVLGKNQCQQCKNGYQTNPQGICEKIPQPQPTPQKHTNTPTLQPSPQPQQPQQPTQQQQTLDPNCIRFDNNNKCALCSNRYYFTDKQAKCIAVNPSCKEYNSAGECTTCYQGYTATSGQCKPQQQTDPKCRHYNNSTNTCTECYSGYFLNDTRCQPVNPLCSTTNPTTGQCATCFSGFTLINGNCIISIRDPYCQSYNSSTGMCQKCSNKYYWSATAVKCQPVSSLCKGWDEVTGLCTVCYEGFRLVNGTCVVTNSKNSDQNCMSVGADGLCVACFSGFFVRNGQCQKVNALCNGANLNTGDCVACYPGYVLLNGQCKIPDPHTLVKEDSNCKEFTDTTRKQCKQCYSGFFVKAGLCTQQNPLCQTSHPTTGTCLTCYQGYLLFNGTCIETTHAPSVLTDPYCIKIQSTTCIECANNYFLTPHNNTCQQKNPLCKTINQSTGWCTTCYNGFRLDTSGNCALYKPENVPFCKAMSVGGNCVECIDGYYVLGGEGGSGECKPVSILCGGLYDRKTGKCTGCLAGHFLQDGECVYPALGVDQACGHYTNGFCDSCVNGYYLRNYFCVQVHRLCSQFDYQRSLCTRCLNNAQPIGADCY